MMLKCAILGSLLMATALADAATESSTDLQTELARERVRGDRLERALEDAARRLQALEQQAARAPRLPAAPAAAGAPAAPRGSPYAVRSSRRLAVNGTNGTSGTSGTAAEESPSALTLADDVLALQVSVDHVWILAAGLICFFLQAGFGMLEAGAIREKNAKNIMLKNLMDACVGGVVYYLFGYALAYGEPESPNDFIGWGNLALAPASEQDYLSWFFQYVFAATIATIVSGAVAERIQFKAYMIYSAVLTGIIYPIASHWIWSGDGFLLKLGVIDYAGGGAVHALSGVAALVAAKALGPRHGRFDEDGKPVAIPAHDTSMMGLGVFILWFGFIPFNAGSGLSVVGAMAPQTARIAVITTLGGCSGAITSLIVGLVKVKHSSLEYCMNGVLAGMVAVCSCCAVVRVWAVFFIVSPLAALAFWLLQWVEEKLQIDDPLGASSLHFGPGMVGLLAVGFLADPEYEEAAYGCDFEYRSGDTCDDFKGIFYGGSGKQLGVQLLAGLCWTAWGVVTCGMLFYGMKFAGVLRVSLEDEIAGLDVAHHGGPAYHSPSKRILGSTAEEEKV